MIVSSRPPPDAVEQERRLLLEVQIIRLSFRGAVRQVELDPGLPPAVRERRMRLLCDRAIILLQDIEARILLLRRAGGGGAPEARLALSFAEVRRVRDTASMT